MSATPEKLRPTDQHWRVEDASFCVVAARFNQEIVDGLLAGARAAFAAQGLRPQAIEVLEVAGAFELPLAAQSAARTSKFDGIIALGAVIRGGTPHFEYVCGECIRGLQQVALQFSMPVGMGVLTVDNVDQAVERSLPGAGNKGAEAALAAMELVALLRRLGG